VGITEKKISINPNVIDKIQNDLINDSVRIYTIPSIPSIFIDNNLFHPKVLESSTCAVIGTSGSPETNLNYMFITPCRLDITNGQYVTDLDPIVMAFDIEKGEPFPSGCVRFHGDFQGRTQEANISLNTYVFDEALEIERSAISDTNKSFTDADRRFTETMHYMAKIFRNNFL
jgi:hypothetical protein